MKTYEQMAQSALTRIKQHETQKKRRKKLAAGIIVPAAVCLTAVLGITAWKSEIPAKPADSLPETSITTLQTTAADEHETDAQTETTAQIGESTAVQTETQIPVTENVPPVTEMQSTETEVQPTAQSESGKKGGDAVSSAGAALLRLGDKLSVSGALYHAIEENPEGRFTVTAFYRPATAEITDFIYEGKTLSEWAIASEDSRFTLQKMHELIKQGEELKYGTALYETGTPDGIKWDKNFYEATIKYFGELIDKYIVNGEFLHEQLSKDIAEYDTQTAVEKYSLAYNSYLENILPSLMQKLTQSGISCERAAYSTNGITFTVTAKELIMIPLDDISFWTFDLAENGQKSTSDTVYVQPASDGTAVN